MYLRKLYTVTHPFFSTEYNALYFCLVFCFVYCTDCPNKHKNSATILNLALASLHAISPYMYPLAS